MRNFSLFCLLFFSCVFSVNAAIEVYQFDDESQEERFNTLIDQLRCPMCLNSNLSGSDAPIAADLRAEIHKQILDGRSNVQIIDFLTQRYGDFINYRPPLNPGTYLLWFGPLILLLTGLVIVWRIGRSSQKLSVSKLTTEEQEKLDNILADKK
ncbi:MAG: cytochrome C biogenesis protein [SAR86 cluster bacterium]|uniref:Cytochrome c-type biogenesis protein n=1 Tax=SAR86 cluster bacterium TaxID=2030880 RepID=A0A2A5CD55_9GAMM|nr:MAG: cytochrome C biogenesis protein [SAR86 cluster bacterium]